MNPTICIVNRSKTVADADIKFVLPALQKQITRHFEPIWGWGANLKFNVKRFDMKVIVKDRASEGGYLGYHIKDGKPITYIFAKDDIDDTGEYTSTLSHELLEMIADPNVNLCNWKVLPKRKKTNWLVRPRSLRSSRGQFLHH